MKHSVFFVQFLLPLWIGGVCLVSCCGNVDHAKVAREQRERAHAEERAALKIGVMPTLDCLPVYLLKDSLLYDTAQADIRLKRFSAHMDIDTALAGGSVQLGVSDMVRAAYLGRRGVYLKAITSTTACWNLYTLKTEKIDSISQLADKTIGMTRYSVTDMFTTQTLRKAKLKTRAFPAQINDVNLRMRMLTNGDLEAAWLPEPQATKARLAGAQLLVDNSRDSLAMGAFVYHEDPMDDFTLRARQMEVFRAAYNKACKTINERGITYFTPLLKKYMGLDDKTIAALPKVKFEGIVTPHPKAVKQAKAFR